MANAAPYDATRALPRKGHVYRAQDGMVPAWLVGRRVIVVRFLTDRDVCPVSPDTQVRWIVVRTLASGRVREEHVAPAEWVGTELGCVFTEADLAP